MDLQPLDGRLFGENQPCFGCSVNHPAGFRLSFVREGDAVVSHFTPGDQYQGPPGIMHGGLVMTLADEAAAWAVIALKETFGFTTGIDGKFRAPVRTGVDTEIRGWIAKDSHRVVRVAVTVRQGETLCFEGELAFVLLDQSGAEKLLQGPLPDAWKKFCR